MGKPKTNKKVKPHKHIEGVCEECGKQMHEVIYLWDDHLEEYVFLEKDGKTRRLTDEEYEEMERALEKHAIESY